MNPLYPAQGESVLELFEDKNVILNTPTGSGKSLVNEKFMALCREFGPDNVGLSTGDASVNRDAPNQTLRNRDCTIPARLLGGTQELARQLKALEAKLTARLDDPEAAIVDVLQRLMRLLDPPPEPEPPRRQIGFHTQPDDGADRRNERREAMSRRGGTFSRKYDKIDIDLPNTIGILYPCQRQLRQIRFTSR